MADMEINGKQYNSEEFTENQIRLLNVIKHCDTELVITETNATVYKGAREFFYRELVADLEKE